MRRLDAIRVALERSAIAAYALVLRVNISLDPLVAVGASRVQKVAFNP
jgi:hypothetical protein